MTRLAVRIIVGSHVANDDFTKTTDETTQSGQPCANFPPCQEKFLAPPDRQQENEEMLEELREDGHLIDDATASPSLRSPPRNSRSLAVDLSPPILNEWLGKALNWLCGTRMKEKYDLPVACDIDDSIDAVLVDLRILLYLAVKELLFNVVKHPNVAEATVELAVHDPAHLRITVADDGFGFDVAKINEENHSFTGFGLIGLNERLEILGGKLEIRSPPNGGESWPR